MKYISTLILTFSLLLVPTQAEEVLKIIGTTTAEEALGVIKFSDTELQVNGNSYTIAEIDKILFAEASEVITNEYDSTSSDRAGEVILAATTKLFGEQDKEDTVVTTATVDTVTDTTWAVTVTLANDTQTDYDAVFKKDSVWIDTISVKADTNYYQVPVAIERTETVQKSDEVVFAPNPVTLADGEMFFTTPSTITGNWQVTIYDAVGNLIDRQEFFSHGGYIYRWNLQNEAGVPVASGAYVAVIAVEMSDGTTEITRRTIGVQK